MDSFMFNGSKQDGPYDFSDSIIPADKYDADGLFAEAADGTQVNLYFVDSSGDVPNRATTTIFYCHGNRDHIGHYWDRVELFYEMGYQTLIFDYRGFGRTKGTPTEKGLYMDAEAAYSYMLTRPDVDPGRVIFYGYSLGCAVCTEMAKRHKTQTALILEAPFRSVKDMVEDGATSSLARSFVTTLKFDNYGKIRDIGSPLFIIHGDSDDYIETQYGIDLYNHALPPKQLWIVPGGNHTTIPGTEGSQRRQEYMTRVPAYIDQYLP